jgi:hypothetical protein
MHEDLGANAGRQADLTERGYRVAVLLDGVSEAACVELMHAVADVLVEHGLASPESGPVRSAVAVEQHDWVEAFPGALHLVTPRAVPRSPDLGMGYSPN